jgi:hypothetical protein
VSYDLNVLFAGLGSSLSYGAEWDPTTGTPIGQVEVDGHLLAVVGSSVGVRTLYLDARAPCGVVARATVRVRVIPAGTSCDVPPAPNPPELVLLAAGGAPVHLPLFGANGLFGGAFVDSSPVVVNGGGSLVTASIESDPRRSVRLTPQSFAGTGTLTVTATDVCGRQASVDVAYQVIDSPTCSADYDPLSEDYFPLAIGNRWRYFVERWNCASPGCPRAPGEEIWDVVSEGSCDMGRRSYEVQIAGTGSGLNGTMVLTVQGNFVAVSRPSTSSFETWPFIQRLRPPSAPDSLNFQHIDCTDGPGNGGDGCRIMEYTIVRGQGVSNFRHSFGSLTGNAGVRLLLLEAPGQLRFSL